MKFTTHLLPFVALSAALVIPDAQIEEQLILQALEAQEAQQEQQQHSLFDHFKGNTEKVWAAVEATFQDAVVHTQNAVDAALDTATGVAHDVQRTFECHHSMTKWDVTAWLDSALTSSAVSDLDHDHDHPPHHRPDHGHHGHKKPKHGGDGGHHHHDAKPNQTVYQLIAGSQYTTRLAKLINEYPDLVEALNGTAANYTVFAPTDKAFEKIPEHGGKKPSKELIKKVLAYHVSADFYPAGRVLVSHTVPTILGEEALGGNPQRLRLGLGLRGLTVNFYSRVVAVNIFGTNGVIHGVDSLLLPPPKALQIIELLPSEFSTFQLALEKTGLFEELSGEGSVGGTLFAPSNWAFTKLGPRVNAFLFSKYGRKYLKALLKYHVVPGHTLYSDAYYAPPTKDSEAEADVPKGQYHYNLPTLLEDKSLSVDIGRWAGLISFKINGFSSVSTQDGIAKNGVIHTVSSILVPPKTPGEHEAEAELEDLSVEEFKARFDTVEEL